MNRRRILPLLLVAVGLVVGVFVNRAISGSTNAQQVNTPSSDKWEYLIITSVAWNPERRVYYAGICHFQPSGCRYSAIEGPELGENDSGNSVTLTTFAKASATLGAAGWEMVGEFAQFGDKAPPRLYFKRKLK